MASKSNLFSCATLNKRNNFDFLLICIIRTCTRVVAVNSQNAKTTQLFPTTNVMSTKISLSNETG